MIISNANGWMLCASVVIAVNSLIATFLMLGIDVCCFIIVSLIQRFVVSQPCLQFFVIIKVICNGQFLSVQTYFSVELWSFWRVTLLLSAVWFCHVCDKLSVPSWLTLTVTTAAMYRKRQFYSLCYSAMAVPSWPFWYLRATVLPAFVLWNPLGELAKLPFASLVLMQSQHCHIFQLECEFGQL